MFFTKQYSELNTEFYTQSLDVVKLIPFLDKSKRYIEPFDRMKNSQIYKVLLANGFDIIHLSSDFNSKDNYDNRIIITNPPFISRGGLYSKMSKMCNEMYLIIPRFSFNCYTKYRNKDNCKRWSDNWEKRILFPVSFFNSPDGIKRVECCFSYWKRRR